MFSSQITIHWHDTFIIWCSLSKHVAKVHRCTHFVLQLHNIATDEMLCLRYGFFYRLRCHFLSLFSMHNLNKECISKLDLSVDPHIYLNLPGSNAVVFIFIHSLNGSTTSWIQGAVSWKHEYCIYYWCYFHNNISDEITLDPTFITINRMKCKIRLTNLYWSLFSIHQNILVCFPRTILSLLGARMPLE